MAQNKAAEKKVNKTEDINAYMREYMREYYKTNDNMWKRKEMCEVCQKEYTVSHRTEHFATKRHKIRELKHRKNA